MAEVVCVRMNWDRTAIPFPHARHYYTMHVSPEPDYPFGRKGLVISSAWRQLAGRQAAGLLILDGDVIIDPADHVAMLQAIHEEPGAVHVAPVRIWPVSTKRDVWSWAHWSTGPSQLLDLRPVWFSFCFTYLPRQLLTAANRAGLRKWTYPGVDMRMSECARENNIPARTVTGCWPKHVNY